MSARNLQIWRLDGEWVSFVFAANDGVPECVYWGERLAEQDLTTLVQCLKRPVTHGMLDVVGPLSLCPEESRGWQGHNGLSLSSVQGERLLSVFAFERAEQTECSLKFYLKDTDLGLALDLELRLSSGDVLVARSTLKLTGTTPIKLESLSAPVLPVPDHCTQLMDFAGRWTGEFQAQTRTWQMGAWLRESPESRTSHGHHPSCFATTANATNTQGEVRAWQLGWSGGHRLIAEEVQDGRRQVQFSMMHTGQVLNQGESFTTAPLYCAYSAQGFNGVAQSYHRFLRSDLIQFPDPKRPRPVHYNCWEAIYLNHDLGSLKTLATQAADLGAERFVLDDGWFKGRNKDNAALGDWVVDTHKYPQGLQPLIDHVQQAGMSFGLWVEPEMVNADSDLYRAHPDWVLGPKQQPTGRTQYVLDLSQDGVLDYLFKALAALLAEYPIDYLKWDHNRVLTGGTYRQALAFYELIGRLRSAFPQVEIESCASGGGRIDYGVLAYTQRVWLSDSNDALERWRMQHEAALLLTPETTGSHVGPRTCHSSGRVLTIAFRAWVAASRHMGFEMDLRELNPEETATLKQITAWWKANRAWLLAGRLHRLDSYDAALIAEMTVAENGERFVVFAAQMQATARNNVRHLRLTGLEPTAQYRLRSAQPDTLQSNATRIWNSPLRSESGVVLSGQALMQAGLALPVAFPAHMVVLEGEKL
ncbi:MAG: alpha-galactosidase [Thiolinea sp.]